jgi:FAD synthetase
MILKYDKRRVLVFGTFDVIHPGHESFLRQAREQGGFLIASIARDSFVMKKKGRKPVHHEQERLRHLKESGLVDLALLSDSTTGTYSVIEQAGADLVCFGHDQLELRDNFLEWRKRNGRNIPWIQLKAYKPEKYKSSLINKTGSP